MCNARCFCSSFRLGRAFTFENEFQLAIVFSGRGNVSSVRITAPAQTVTKVTKVLYFVFLFFWLLMRKNLDSGIVCFDAITFGFDCDYGENSTT